jgi:MEDS: MEthanogen/methylotroph, DcmR Sensory domain
MQVALGESQSALVVDALRHELTKIIERGGKAPYHHEVQFYSNEVVLIDRAVPFVAGALKSGDAAIVIATKSHRDSLVQRLKSEGLDVDAAIKAGMYVEVDAAGALAKIMVHDMPKSARLFKLMGGLIEQAMKAGKKAHPRVAVFGEGVSLLWEEGKADAAIRVEQLWNQLALIYEIDTLCAYRMSSTHGEEDDHDFESVCAEHSAIYSQRK